MRLGIFAKLDPYTLNEVNFGYKGERKDLGRRKKKENDNKVWETNQSLTNERSQEETNQSLRTSNESIRGCDEHSSYVFLYLYFIVFSSVNCIKTPNLATC